jgi:hypothetical protein
MYVYIYIYVLAESVASTIMQYHLAQVGAWWGWCGLIVNMHIYM